MRTEDSSFCSVIETRPSTLSFNSLKETQASAIRDFHGFHLSYRSNRPRSIYQYSNMGPRLSGLTSIFGVVFFVSKSPVGIERQKKLEKFAIFTRKPRSHA